jgi:hypothetical protein
VVEIGNWMLVSGYWNWMLRWLNSELRAAELWSG